MNPFPGWRRAGQAMRWARKQHGVTVKVRRFPRQGGYTVHTWTDSTSRSVTVGHGGNFTTADNTAINGPARWDEGNLTTDQALHILTVTGLLPLAIVEAAS